MPPLRRAHPLARPVAVACAVAVVLGGCTSEADSPTSEPRAEVTGPAECAELIPAGAVEALGWQPSAAPRVEDTTCVLDADDGRVTAQRRPVPAGAESELPASATEQFDARCAELGSILDDEPGEETDWLAPDRRACVALPAEGRPGTSSLLALVSPTVLMEFRLESDAALAADQVQTALTELADAATGATESGEVVASDAPEDPDERCAAVVTDAVVDELGWSEVGAAVRGPGRCERGGEGMLLTVGADPTVRPDAGRDRVERAYARACAGLSEAGEPVPEQDPEWLGLRSGETACVRGLGPDRAGGLVRVYTLSDSGWLVHAQVTDDGDTPTGQVRSAVALLVAQSIAADWG